MLCVLTNRNRELLIQANSYDMLATKLRYGRVDNPQDREEFNRLHDALYYVVGMTPCYVEDLNRDERWETTNEPTEL
jgi:hypothetical protein